MTEAMTDPVIPGETTAGDGELSNWEFLETPPTRADVERLLATLPDVYGVSYAGMVEYVQALPAQKKFSRPDPRNDKAKIDVWVDTWSLYMSVVGRQVMLQRAVAINGWIEVDFEPEPVTPTGVPGYLETDPRVIYREYLTIKAPIGLPTTLQEKGIETRDGSGALVSGPPKMTVHGAISLGRKPGTAWAPRTGGTQAKGSNPYEKVETAARGRAIAAWGIGVLPGSGVASVEEMAQIRENAIAAAAEGQPAQGGPRTRVSRSEPAMPPADMLSRILETAEILRQERGQNPDEMAEKLGRRLLQIGAPRDCYDPATFLVDWDKVKPGTLHLLMNDLVKSLADYRAEQATV
jgi:hypothetical protein